MVAKILFTIKEMRSLWIALSREIPSMDDDDKFTITINETRKYIAITRWTSNNDYINTIQIDKDSSSNG